MAQHQGEGSREVLQDKGHEQSKAEGSSGWGTRTCKRDYHYPRLHIHYQEFHMMIDNEFVCSPVGPL
jgi:hypothetical protein